MLFLLFSKIKSKFPSIPPFQPIFPPFNPNSPKISQNYLNLGELPQFMRNVRCSHTISVFSLPKRPLPTYNFRLKRYFVITLQGIESVQNDPQSRFRNLSYGCRVTRLATLQASLRYSIAARWQLQQHMRYGRIAVTSAQKVQQHSSHINMNLQ